jgi:hypothetical protein
MIGAYGTVRAHENVPLRCPPSTIQEIEENLHLACLS